MTAPARREGIVSEINTLLGRGTSFEGKLTFEGSVRIDGKLKGEIFSDDTLIIGEGAYVEAEIDIGEIIVQGTLVGNVRAKRSIEVLAPGRVKGDLHTPSLMVEKGVLFEGRSFMESAVGQKVGAPAGKDNPGPSATPAKDGPPSPPKPVK
ncbi:MAG: polymer-forming cytoskeletal protein [Kofleriaceae bacterium]